MSKSYPPIPSGFPTLLKEIKARIQQAQTRAILAANTELVRLYWDIGRLIDDRQEQEGWGAAVIPRLSRELHNELPEIKGFSERNIKSMLAFYRAYRDPSTFVQQPANSTSTCCFTRMAHELERVGKVVGRQGKTRQRAKFGRTEGAWGEMENSVNTLVDDLIHPITEVTAAISAVAQGDLLQRMRLDVDGRPLEGEFLRSATIVNTMIEQLGVFTSEVTRVAREVGTDGKLGGQAQIREVSGVWRERKRG